MKMTGMWASASSALKAWQVSNPSIPGMTASRRMMSGVICRAMASARSPRSATRAVAPAVSSASASIATVSAESSTTRTMSREVFCVGVLIERGLHV